MMKYCSINHLFFVLVTGMFVLSSCDSGGEGDGLVSVRYALSGSDGVSVYVGFFDKQNRWSGASVSSGWTYEFRVEEASRMLVLSTSEVRDGDIRAEIFIEGVLRSSHTNTDSLRYSRSSFEWTPGDGTLRYYFQSKDNITRPQIKLPSGEDSELVSTHGYGDVIRGSKEFVGVAGAPVSMSLSRPEIGLSESSRCVELILDYAPTGDRDHGIYSLDSVEQCTTGAIDLRVEATLPGG